MLETPDAIEHAEEIATAPGVDILHIGTTDLCDAMGMPGKYADPAIEKCFERRVQRKMRKAEVIVSFDRRTRQAGLAPVDQSLNLRRL
jgi:2-keto-3-deoxy-L-rhamnonate aldolase RhmA